VTCTVAIAACGSSTKPSGTAASHQTSGLGFAQCMRSHGVPNYPDPSQTGGGLAVGSGTGLDPQSPAFQSAARDCRKLQPGPHGGGEIPESTNLSMLAQARCMRANGVPNYPDPNIPSHYPLRVEPPPGINTDAPAFKRATAACGGG
jgi:hypothetical protein